MIRAKMSTILFLLASILFVGCKDTPNEEASDTDPPSGANPLEATPPKQDPPGESVAETPVEAPRLHVKALKEGAKADIDAFKGKWVGKTVELEGTVGAMQYNPRDHRSGMFIGESESDLTVICWGALRAWDHYQTGKQGVVRGTIAMSRLNAPFLENATFVSSEGGGMPRVTVEEFIEAFQADADAAREKYHDKKYVISGKALRLEGSNALILQGRDDLNFELHYMTFEASYFEADPGEEVTALGKLAFGSIYLNHEKMGATMCIRLPDPQ